MPTYDFETKNRRDFPTIPAGIYEATIERVEEKTARSGNKYKQITFRLFGEKAALSGVEGRLVWDNIVLLKQVEWKIQNLLYACKLSYEGKVSLSDDWHELVGRELRIYVGVREYQGSERNDVKSFYPKIEEAGKKEEEKKEEPKERDEEINLEEMPF